MYNYNLNRMGNLQKNADEIVSLLDKMDNLRNEVDKSLQDSIARAFDIINDYLNNDQLAPEEIEELRNYFQESSNYLNFLNYGVKELERIIAVAKSVKNAFKTFKREPSEVIDMSVHIISETDME